MATPLLGPSPPSLFAASVNLLFHVSPLMCYEIGAVAEALATLWAFVRLLPRVDSLMYDEN